MLSSSTVLYKYRTKILVRLLLLIGKALPDTFFC
jgi:hypothetical protein